jgi:hypothetical protein
MSRPFPRRFAIVLFFVLAARLTGSSRGDELETKIGNLARSIAGLLSQRNEVKVAIGEFAGAAALRASAGPGIAQSLTEALFKLNVTSDEEAAIEIGGEYFLAEGSGGSLPSMKVKFKVVDTKDGRNEIAKPEIDLFDAAVVARLSGATGDISGKTNRERSRKVRESLKVPAVVINRPGGDSSPASRVSVPGTPYALEVLVKSGSEYEPREAFLERGRPFVALRRDDICAIRLSNDSPLDAAVELCVDGVNVFALHNDPSMRKARIIIPAGKSELLRGFPVSNTESKEFLLARIDAPVDSRLLPKGNPKLGTITALFAAAWKQGDAPPRDEPTGPIVESSDDNRIIPGTSFENKIELVEVEVGKPRVQISIRYNKPVE